MKDLDRCFLDGAVHPFHLSVCPWMVDLGKVLVNIVLATCTGKDEFKGRFIALLVCELAAVIRENGMDFIRNGFNEFVQKRGGLYFPCRRHQLDKGMLRFI